MIMLLNDELRFLTAQTRLLELSGQVGRDSDLPIEPSPAPGVRVAPGTPTDLTEALGSFLTEGLVAPGGC